MCTNSLRDDNNLKPHVHRDESSSKHYAAIGWIKQYITSSLPVVYTNITVLDL